MRGFHPGNIRRQFLMRARLGQPTRFLCASSNNSTKTNKAAEEAASIRDFDAYHQLDKLDFMTAAKILFTTSPKKKKFGLDFHLVQLFFVCMPSLAVYLVALYARHEIKRMEGEVEVKKKQAEKEEKAKEMEALALEEEKRKSDPELLQVKVRLEALEEAVKGIVVDDSKKQSSSNLTKDLESIEKQKLETVKPKSESKSEDSSTAIDDRRHSLNSGSLKPDSSQQAISKPVTAIDSPTHDQEKGKSKS